MILLANIAEDSKSPNELFEDEGAFTSGSQDQRKPDPQSKGSTITFDNNPDRYIEQIAQKEPGFQVIFKVMNLKFRHENHRLQQSLQRIEKQAKAGAALKDQYESKIKELTQA